MLVRYSTSDKGTAQKRAFIYTADEHGIDRNDIDPDAVKITERLKRAGYTAYIVGGAVRDLLVGKRPKDFDVVTDATPRNIKRLFRNSRIIGKRFRLVHIFFGEKIIEVSTFRSNDAEANTFGTLEEDVQRRDFRMNALYYCPQEQTILDYVGGYRDIRRKRVRALIPLKTIFTEDPVRMIRAVKYSATTGFKLPFFLRLQIRRCSGELAKISASRLTEELSKILGSGAAAGIFELARRYKLLKHILPVLDNHMNAEGDGFSARFFSRMEELDKRVKSSDDIKRGRMLSFLFQDYLADRDVLKPSAARRSNPPQDPVSVAFLEAKQFLKPLAPPNRDVEEAVRFLVRRKRKRRNSRTRNRRKPADRTSESPEKVESRN